MIHLSVNDEHDACTLKCSSGLHVSSEQVQHHLGQPEALVHARQRAHEPWRMPTVNANGLGTQNFYYKANTSPPTSPIA